MNEVRLIEYWFLHPLVTIAHIREALGNVSYTTASRSVARLQEFGLLEEMTGKRRDRVYRYAPFIELFNDGPGYQDEVARLVTSSTLS